MLFRPLQLSIMDRHSAGIWVAGIPFVAGGLRKETLEMGEGHKVLDDLKLVFSLERAPLLNE